MAFVPVVFGRLVEVERMNFERLETGELVAGEVVGEFFGPLYLEFLHFGLQLFVEHSAHERGRVDAGYEGGGDMAAFFVKYGQVERAVLFGAAAREVVQNCVAVGGFEAGHGLRVSRDAGGFGAAVEIGQELVAVGGQERHGSRADALGALFERGAEFGGADHVRQIGFRKLLEELLESSGVGRGGRLSGERIGGQDETGEGQECEADYEFHISAFWLVLRQNGANWFFRLEKKVNTRSKKGFFRYLMLWFSIFCGENSAVNFFSILTKKIYASFDSSHSLSITPGVVLISSTSFASLGVDFCQPYLTTLSSFFRKL